MKSDLPVTPSFRLDGRSALVTGASRGIGLAAAVALAEAGANVVLAARSVDDLAQAADAINERCNKQSASFVELDMADTDSIEKVVSSMPAPDLSLIHI